MDSTIIALSALFVSVVTLGVGGAINSIWNRFVTKPRIFATIIKASFSDDDNKENKAISITQEVVERSCSSKLFPTLKPVMPVEKVKGILKQYTKISSYLPAVRMAFKEVSKDGVSDERAGVIWGEIPGEVKAAIFTLRTSRNKFNVLEKINPTTALERMQEGGDVMDVLKKQLLGGMLGGAITKIHQVETHPTKELVMEILQEELDGLELFASEVGYFVDNIDINSAPHSSHKLTIKVNAFNSGGVPAVIIPVACLAIERQAAGNLVVPLKLDDERENIIIPPGEAIDINFTNSDSTKKDFLSSLLANYSSGDRDCCVILRGIDGKLTSSAAVNFSPDINSKVLDELQTYSTSHHIK